MRFGMPHNFWLLLLLPIFGLFLAWAIGRKRRALALFVDAAMVPRLTESVAWGRQYAKTALWLMALLWLVLALTGPQFGAKLALAQRKGVDVMVVLDVSRSMLAEDIRPNRLERAKYQIRQLLGGLEGDRVGLVVFAGKAFTQCPLTLDYGALNLLLDIVDTELIPVQGTSLGAALTLAHKAFDADDRQYKVIVLFTDGEDQGSGPLKAARAAAEAGARIFAVGFGSPEGELIPVRRDGSVSYHKDGSGNYVKTRLDEAGLQEIALTSDGAYYRSSLGGGEVEAILAEIGDMDRKDLGSTRFTQYEERFQIPLLVAILCLAAEMLLADRRRRKSVWQGRFS